MQQAEATITTLLRAIGCPMAESSVWTNEFAFGPDESRLDVIEWLMDVISPGILKQSVKGLSVSATAQEQRQQKLAVLLSALGLCREDDLQLIQGTCSLKKQADFMLLLCETAVVARRASGANLSLDTALADANRQMDVICTPANASGVFGSECKLLASDLTKLLAQELSKPVPTQEQLTLVVSRVGESVKQQTAVLAELESQVDPSRWSQAELSGHQQLCAEMVQLRNLITVFSDVFAREIQPWTNRQAPKLSNIGPACRDLWESVQRIVKLLQNIDECYEHARHLSQSLGASVERLTREEKTRQSTASASRMRSLAQMLQA